jgi:predicted AAA+ superfamily ATPase
MIYDFLDIDLIFTSSVSLSLFESSYDLSRRVKILKIYPFSFREYIYFRENTLLDPLTISDIYNENFKAEYLRYGYLFKEYIKGGIFPFSLDGIDVIETLRNVLERVITRDIPSLSDITVAETNLIKDTFRFISLSTSEGINYSSISKNVGITKYKAQQYIQLLEKAFIINQVLPYGTNVMREPKILLAPPFRLINNEYSSVVGYLREDFVVEALKMRDFEVFYLKSMRGEKTPDFFITEKNTRYVIEVGGKGKGRSQFKGFSGYKKIVLSDTENLSKKGHKPIYLIGYI